MRDFGLFGVVVAVNTVLSLSTAAAQWWSLESSPSTTPLPSAADSVLLAARAGTGDADAHVVLWFAAAVTLAWALRHARAQRIVLAGLALWAYTGVLEVVQHWVPGRSSSWADLAGNAFGIAIGLSVGMAASHLIDRRSASRIPTV